MYVQGVGLVVSSQNELILSIPPLSPQKTAANGVAKQKYCRETNSGKILCITVKRC
jgi:hypothetical protein